MDQMECHVAVGGDVRQVVVLSGENKVSWPEVCILKEVHGTGSITEIKVIGEFPEDAVLDERNRLSAKYGEGVVSKTFGALYGTNLPLKAPPDVPRYDDEVIEIVRKPKAKVAAKKPEPQTIFDP